MDKKIPNVSKKPRKDKFSVKPVRMKRGTKIKPKKIKVKI